MTTGHPHGSAKGKEELAIFGGTPIRVRQWPKWPRADSGTQRNLLDVLHSSKWTLSGQADRTLSYERRFSEAFALYCGKKFGIGCGNGTAALMTALQALEIGPGDEVVVPGLTWIACASAVANVGAIPILADIDPQTLCVTPETLAATLGPNTRAIVAVHLYSSLAPMPDIMVLANSRGIPVIEDASQAHGGLLGGRRTGAFGTIGVFSMQQSKLLSSGEGGACITDDPALYRRMQQLRADGRVYADQAGCESAGFQREISACGEVLGRNFCLSEFHAAILLDRLLLLDVENAHRRRNFARLGQLLSRLPGIRLVTGAPAEENTHYRVCLMLEDTLLQGLPISAVARAMTAELRLPVDTVDKPLNANPLYRPHLSPMLSRLAWSASYDARRFILQNAHEAERRCLTIPHWGLLGDESDLEDIVCALQKVLHLRRSELAEALPHSTQLLD